MYCTQEESAAFLFHHPSLNSLVVSSTKRHRQHSAPPNKERKKLDSFGKCLYSTGALDIKSCNYMVCMAHIIHAIF